MSDFFTFLTGALVVVLSIKVLILENDVNTLYRAICRIDGTKQERSEENEHQ